MKKPFLFCVTCLFLLSFAANVQFLDYMDEDDFDDVMSYSTKDSSAFNIFTSYSVTTHQNFCMMFENQYVTENEPGPYPIRISSAYTYLGRSPWAEVDLNVSFSVYKVNRSDWTNAVGERIGYSGSLQETSDAQVLNIYDMSIDVYEPYFWACFSVYRNSFIFANRFAKIQTFFEC